MKWLADFTDVGDIDIKEYCDRMTATGSKVEGWERLSEDVQGVVVARILKCSPHPDADRLTVCSVDAGAGETIQVITAAKNVFDGAIVPVAKNGANLPGGVKIKTGKLRGLPSEGMFCSIAELGLTLHDMPDAVEDGILILDEDFADKIGMDIRAALGMDDCVVDFEITSNRPDCLSVIGLARETAVSFDRECRIPAPAIKRADAADDVKKYIDVSIAAPELCLRYSAAVVKNVKIAPSPLWLRMRLRAAGVRPINNIVDITNYVMLEYGQPMHAFDYTCLDGAKIVVRRAAEGEPYRSLDDIDHVLKSSMLVIADEKKPVALAGVMGGANSEIKDDTATVVFESACFDGPCVRLAAKALGMRTESSSRFEKGMDPENTMPALLRACELVELLGAGTVVDGVIDVYPGKKPMPTLPLDADRINRFLGVSLTREYMEKVMTDLGFKVADGCVTPPSWRGDIGCMNDLAEEIIRIYGYNEIKSSRFSSEVSEGGRTAEQNFACAAVDALVGMGLDEIETFSFISPKYYDNIGMAADDARRKSVVISNPLGEDTSVMRTTALPSMLEVLERNNNYGAESVRLFEAAKVYIPNESADELPDEKVVYTIGMFGGCDFYTIKGVIEGLLGALSVDGASYVAAAELGYHPGRCAKIIAGEKVLGVFGELHPEVAETFGFTPAKRVYAAELDFAALYAAHTAVRHYSPLPKFPAVTRDFSFVCDESLTVGEIEKVMAEAGGSRVESVRLFDIYRDARIGAGKKSLAFSVTLRAPDKTLTDEEADKAAAKIVNALRDKWGIELRK